MDVRICLGLPVYGDAIERWGLDVIVDAARDAGVEGLWVGDHVVLAQSSASDYHGRPDGRFFVEPAAAWYEACVTLGYVAARAGAMDLGFFSLPALRPPPLLAKQIATVSRLAEGGLTLGVGAGWLRAEFEALAVPWERRGTRLEDNISVMRACWTGEPAAGDYGVYAMPEGITCHPTPRAEVPILVGGASAIAFDRAARVGDGWVGAVHRWDDALAVAGEQVEGFRAAWAARRGEAEDPAIALVSPIPRGVARRAEFDDVLLERVLALGRLGFGNLVFGISWQDVDDAVATLGAMGRVAAAARAQAA